MNLSAGEASRSQKETTMKYYWVYVPDVDEAGCVVQADSFEDAFTLGCEQLNPDVKAEVQVHELGGSQEFIVPNYPFTEADECDEFCATHDKDCDGFCDHMGEHQNMCLSAEAFEALKQEYNDLEVVK